MDGLGTIGAGDQGLDILAEKDGKSIAIQCKNYSKLVGNKTVQEAFSAHSFIDGDFSAVVSRKSRK